MPACQGASHVICGVWSAMITPFNFFSAGKSSNPIRIILDFISDLVKYLLILKCIQLLNEVQIPNFLLDNSRSSTYVTNVHFTTSVFSICYLRATPCLARPAEPACIPYIANFTGREVFMHRRPRSAALKRTLALARQHCPEDSRE